MNEELDSQLSAMFDDELPAVECELLARAPVARRGAEGALEPVCGDRLPPSEPKVGVRLERRGLRGA